MLDQVAIMKEFFKKLSKDRYEMKNNVYGLVVGYDIQPLPSIIKYIPFGGGGLDELVKNRGYVKADIKEGINYIIIDDGKLHNPISSILVAKARIYVSLGSLLGIPEENLYEYKDGNWRSLGSIKSADDEPAWIKDIALFDNKVLVVGYKQVFSDVKGNQLISFEDFDNEGIESIDGIVVDGNELFLYGHSTLSGTKLVRVNYNPESNKFTLDKVVRDYKWNFASKSRFLGKEGDEYFFIHLSPGESEFSEHIAINGVKVEGSEISPFYGFLRDLKIVNNDFDKKEVGIIVAGYHREARFLTINSIYYMGINYKDPNKPRVDKKVDVVLDTLNHITALDVVKDKELHEKLMSLKDKS